MIQAVKYSLLLLTTVLVVAGCQLLGPHTAKPETLVVRSGQSFGFCVGYCYRELELSGAKQILETKGHLYNPTNQEYPDYTNEWELNESKWDSLTSLIDELTFLALDDVYGCPDCADGGSEWIEVDFLDGESKRVTFEFGASVPGISDLVVYARKLRQDAIERAESM